MSIQPGTPLPWCQAYGEVMSVSKVTKIANCKATAATIKIADAAYIVHACNLYPELLSALQNLLPEALNDRYVEQSDAVVAAYAAIAKATAS